MDCELRLCSRMRFFFCRWLSFLLLSVQAYYIHCCREMQSVCIARRSTPSPLHHRIFLLCSEVAGFLLCFVQIRYNSQVGAHSASAFCERSKDTHGNPPRDTARHSVIIKRLQKRNLVRHTIGEQNECSSKRNTKWKRARKKTITKYTQYTAR